MSKRRRAVRRNGRQHGYILVWFAAMMIVLLVFAGFAVDLGFWYLTGRNAQRVADSAALAGVVHRQGDVVNNPDAIAAAEANAAENGYISDVDDTAVTVRFDDVDGTTLPLSQLRVEVKRKAPSFFTRLLGFDGVDITRDAVAEYSPSPPLGSPSNVLGNDGLVGTETFPTDTNIDLNQSFWLDVQGPRSPTVNGDQYQTDNCRSLRIAQGQGTKNPFVPPNFTYLGPFEPEPCNSVTGVNEHYTEGSGSKGYNYVVEVQDAEADDLVDVEVFDPAFVDAGEDCERGTFSTPASINFSDFSQRDSQNWNLPVDVVSQLGLPESPEPLARSGQQIFLGAFSGTANRRALPKLSGGIAHLAQKIIDDDLLTKPATPNASSSADVVTKYNLWATLTNFGITEDMMEDVAQRFLPGPNEPACTGDSGTGANLIPTPGFKLLVCLFGCGGGWLPGTSLTDAADISTIEPAEPGGHPINPPGSPPAGDDPPGAPPAIPFDAGTVLATPAAHPAATPIRPAATNLIDYDGLPETRFSVAWDGGTLRDHTDNQEQCQETYGWYSPLLPTEGGGLFGFPKYGNWDIGNSGYFWNYVFNGIYQHDAGTVLDLYLGNISYGTDIKSFSLVSGSGVPTYGHGFRETARQWVNPCGQIEIQDEWIQGGTARFIVNVDTSLWDGGVTTQKCNSASSTCGRGGNRFALRALNNGEHDGVKVYAESRLQLLGNFQGSSGDFWLTELQENDTRDRVLRLTFHDPGDIAVCRDEDGDGKTDPDPNPNDDISVVQCSPAGYGGVDSIPGAGDIVGTLKILKPHDPADTDPPEVFDNCTISRVSDPDPPISVGTCEIDTLDYTFNGDLLEIKIDIDAGEFSCDGPTGAECWIKAQFDYPGATGGTIVRPSDATTWTAILEGVPVRLVE